ncbi:MAG: hypothetical protein K0R99_3784 [Microbacterium sp.]|nr:hypothetical protein [Microbacterium sp.]
MTERNEWPATTKQKAYGRALEDRLGVERSPWASMTVADAAERIAYLIEYKESRRLIESALAS